MSKRKRETDVATIERRIHEGRGQGTGADYKPWLVIQDISSQGLVSRVKGKKTGRIHHLFSNHEQNYFYILDMSPQVQDIQEQYPLLPLETTQKIAQELGVRHPADPKTRSAIVMTTDFVVTSMGQKHARTLKLSKELTKQRTLEKLEIERLYWQAHHIDWGIVTEHEIPKKLAANARLLHNYHDISERQLPHNKVTEIANTLAKIASAEQFSLRNLANHCDTKLGLKPGTSLAVAYHLIATHRWSVDLMQPLDSSRSLAWVSPRLQQEVVPCVLQ